MRLAVLTEDPNAAREMMDVADIVERSPAMMAQFKNLPNQIRELATVIKWQPPLNIDMRRQLCSKMGGLRVGREYEDRVPLLEEMQSKNKFDYDAIQEQTNILKHNLERSFPGMTVLARTKSMDSINNKLRSEDYQGKGLHQIKDLIGARIICPMKGTLPGVVNSLEDKIDVYRKRNYFRDNDERPMQANQVGDDYYGLNYLTNAGPWGAEVQMTVKPLEVWNDLQHGLIYKPAAKPNQLLLEKLAHVRDNVLWHVFMGQR